MAKRKLSDTLSLDPKEQKKVSKEINQVKKKIEKGEITIKDERKAQKITAEQKRGLIFISHLPHGFYEDQLKDYFKQFGKVTNVKVCRSNKTGRSKGYGYVEFSHPEVAKIAGETMNNYLMFKKRLSVEYIPYEKRPKHLFHGKSSTEHKYSAKTRRNKQFQANAIADEKTCSVRTKKRISRLNKKLKRLSDLGLDAALGLPKTTEQKSNSEDCSDSELEIKIKNKKRARRPTSEPIKNKLQRSVDKPDKSSEMSLDTSVNFVNPILPSKPKTKKAIIKKKLKTAKGSTKQNPKLAALNAGTVKKIARELIRKKGHSLLNFPTPNKNTSKKK